MAVQFTYHLLEARKLFGSHDSGDSSSNSTLVCPSQNESGPAIVPLVGSMTFHTLATIISGAFGIVAILISFLTIMRHAMHYTDPTKQRQVIRILMLVPWFSLVAFFSIWLESAAIYFKNATDVAESFAIAAFLLLLCDYIMSDPDGLNMLFGQYASSPGKSPGFLKVSLFPKTFPWCLDTAKNKIAHNSRLASLVHGPPIHPSVHSDVDHNGRIECHREILCNFQ
jgi:hypothetical protein